MTLYDGSSAMSEATSLDYLLEELEQEDRGRRRDEGSDVCLNVYDMLWLNSYVSPFGIGAFHSGVEVHGREYAYGGHPYSYTGIYDMEPRQEDEIAGEGIQFRESRRLGRTHLSEAEVRELVHTLGKEYNGNTYHILNKNCNHFTSDLCQRLCGAEPPRWVNRLAYVGSWMPFLLNCIPPHWLTPGVETTGNAILCSSRSQSQSSAQHVESDPEVQSTRSNT